MFSCFLTFTIRPLSEKERVSEQTELIQLEKHRKEISVVTEKGGKVVHNFEHPYIDFNLSNH